MFDYALLRRPMLFYVPDLAYYSQVDPLTYFDLREVAPGPVLESTEEIIDAMGRLDALGLDHKERYKDFLERFCPLDDGQASETVVRTVWGPGRLKHG
jgi:CDP-glycerol glycerophosphotransferase